MTTLSARYLAGFMALGLLAGTSNGVAKVLLPLYAAVLQAPPWQIGLVGGLQFIGTLFLSLPIGALIDRHGSRPLFRFGGLAGAALYLFGFSQVSAPLQLIGVVILFGLINPFRMVTTQTEFLGLLPRLGVGKAGWQRASHTLGMFFIGPTLGAFLLGLLGFSDTFRLVSTGLLLAVIIGDRVLSVAPAGRGADATPFVKRLREQVSVVITRAALRQSMLIEFCGQVAMSYFSVFVILIGIRQFSMSTQEAAGLVTMQGALFVGTLFAGGRLFVSLSESARYLLAFALLLGSQVLLCDPASRWFLWAAAALLGLGLGTQHLTSVGRFASLAQELGRGKVGGLFSLAGPAGGLVGAVAGGALSQHFGLLAGFRVLAVLYVLQLGWQFYRWLPIAAREQAAVESGCR